MPVQFNLLTWLERELRLWQNANPALKADGMPVNVNGEPCLLAEVHSDFLLLRKTRAGGREFLEAVPLHALQRVEA